MNSSCARTLTRRRASGSRRSTAPSSSRPIRKFAATPRWTTWTSARSRISACNRWNCARSTGKNIQVQKPMATDLETAREMIDIAQRRRASCWALSSQHRFDDSSQFLNKAIPSGRLGKILQADAYVKWYRSAAYYSRPIKGSWATEGGGALMNQAHSPGGRPALDHRPRGGAVRLLATWARCTRSNPRTWSRAVLRYRSGATGVIQASTAFWPGYTERLEVHGTKGTADHFRRQAHHLGCGGRLGRSRAGGQGGAVRRVGSDGDFAGAFRARSSWISARRSAPAASRWSRARRATRRWRLCTAIYNSCREGQKVGA